MAKINAVTERQKEIIDAARRIIGSRGMGELTIRELAKEINLTEGALYRHFKSKKEIISLLIDDIENSLLTTIEEALNKGQDPLSSLHEILFHHISYAEQRKGLTFLLINEVMGLKNAHLQKKMYSVIEQYLKKIRGVLAGGVESRVFRKNMDVALASLAFFGLVQSLVTFWSLSDFKFSITKGRIEELFAIYKEGIIRK